MNNFYTNINQVLKYSVMSGAGPDQLAHMLQVFQSREHAINRMGGPNANHTLRGQLADAIEDQDTGTRENPAQEAALLRDPYQHVMVHKGKIVPAVYIDRFYRLEPRIREYTHHRTGSYPSQNYGGKASYGMWTVAPMSHEDWPELHASEVGPFYVNELERVVHPTDKDKEYYKLLEDVRNYPFEEPEDEFNSHWGRHNKNS